MRRTGIESFNSFATAYPKHFVKSFLQRNCNSHESAVCPEWVSSLSDYGIVASLVQLERKGSRNESLLLSADNVSHRLLEPLPSQRRGRRWCGGFLLWSHHAVITVCHVASPVMFPAALISAKKLHLVRAHSFSHRDITLCLWASPPVCLREAGRLAHPNGFHACQFNHLCVGVPACRAWRDLATRCAYTTVWLQDEN